MNQFVFFLNLKNESGDSINCTDFFNDKKNHKILLSDGNSLTIKKVSDKVRWLKGGGHYEYGREGKIVVFVKEFNQHYECDYVEVGDSKDQMELYNSELTFMRRG